MLKETKDCRSYKCPECGVSLNIMKETYAQHLTNYHGKRHQPVRRMTPQEIAEVVKRVEGRFAPFIFGGIQKQVVVKNLLHKEDCICDSCFQIKLDILVMKSEKGIEEIKQTVSNSMNVEIEIGEVQWQG